MIADRRRRNRDGQSLILFLFILIALAGVFALTFDYGFVLLARRQMQTGVSAAALEGSRDPSQPRDSARQLLRLNYDDDLELGSNDTAIGAGIANNLTQGDGFRSTTLGDGSLGTSGILATRSDYIFRPDGFELNAGNEVHGDIVVGNYDGGDDQHSEASDYQRTDFVADDMGTSLLVRMRRTHDPNNLDNLDDVSSNGGGIPLLMGRLALFSATQVGDDYSIRRDGTTVRATSIASNRRIVCVFVSTSPLVYPLLPYTLLVDGATETWRTSQVSDLYTADPDNPSQDLIPRRVSIGKVVTGTATVPPLNPEGYVTVVNASERIIGFRLFESAPPRHRSDSARLQDPWPELQGLSDSDRQAVLNENGNPSLNLDATPVLVRSVR